MLRSKRSITLAFLGSVIFSAFTVAWIGPRVAREWKQAMAEEPQLPPNDAGPAETVKVAAQTPDETDAAHEVSKPLAAATQFDPDAGVEETPVTEEDLREVQRQVRELLKPQPKSSERIRPIPEPEKHVVRLHRAPLHNRRLTPGNFEYRGAFRLPQVEEDQPSRFPFGGITLAFRPDGDPNGEVDGYPGSLFTVGHDQQQMVAEISIPKPRYLVDRRGKDLPPAKLLQGFSDISDGFIAAESAGVEPFKIGGLFVTKNRLHWTLYKYYNVDGVRYDSHATSSLNLSKPKPDGLWHLGQMNGGGSQWHSYKNAGYIFDVPPERRSDLGGLKLISGLNISTGRQTSSQGPAMYAYRLPKRGTPAGSSLDAIPLVYHPLGGGELAQHNPADHWRGGAWIKVGRKEGIIICGRKSLGPEYYGEARRQDCTEDKGYHGTPYEPQMLFYDAEDVLKVADGKLRPWFVEPYIRWGSHSRGGGLEKYFFDTCHARIEGVAFDRANSLLYVIQFGAASISLTDLEKYPIVHIFKIKDV